MAKGLSSSTASTVDPSAFTVAVADPVGTTFAAYAPPVQIALTLTQRTDVPAYRIKPCPANATIFDVCGITYSAQYRVKLANVGLVPTGQQITVRLRGDYTDNSSSPKIEPVFYQDYDLALCNGLCTRNGEGVFNVESLPVGASAEFDVYFTTPFSPNNSKVSASASDLTFPVPNVLASEATSCRSDMALNTACVVFTTLQDGPPQGSSDLNLPRGGGSSAAKNVFNTGNFFSRVDVPPNDKIQSVKLDVTDGGEACSPAYQGYCLKTAVTIPNFGGAGVGVVDGYLRVVLIRDWKTLPKNLARNFNAPLFYGVGADRVPVPRCKAADLLPTATIERCVEEQIDTIERKNGELVGGSYAFIVRTRHNGVYSW